jgi:hypothetical protein
MVMKSSKLNVVDEEVDAKECFDMVRRPGYGSLSLKSLVEHDSFDYRMFIESSICAGIGAKLRINRVKNSLVFLHNFETVSCVHPFG